jgi:putative salt-induced outer membrane protein YdiY
MKTATSWMTALGTVSVAILITASAVAQPLPEGLMDNESATEGKTDVVKDGFEAAPELDKDAKDTTELKISAGGLFTTGNSRALSLTGASKFKLRRDANQLSAAAAGNFARSAATPDDSMETTLENFQGRVRYDRFFTEVLAGFLAASATRDRFQGLDLRLNVDPGIAFYIIDHKGHQLWSEVGYDLQHDIRRDEAIDAALLEGDVVDKSETRHNGRAFVGYDNSLNEEVTFNTGLEYIQGLQDTTNWRLAWDAGLTSNIGESFAIATTFSLKYDHNPLPGVENTDAITAVSVVYNLL